MSLEIQKWARRQVAGEGVDGGVLAAAVPESPSQLIWERFAVSTPVSSMGRPWALLLWSGVNTLRDGLAQPRPSFSSPLVSQTSSATALK